MQQEEILEPLTPSILECLEHRHSFVRRNAVLAINALYRLPKGELLLQDAPELIEKVLQVWWLFPCMPAATAPCACVQLPVRLCWSNRHGTQLHSTLQRQAVQLFRSLVSGQRQPSYLLGSMQPLHQLQLSTVEARSSRGLP